MVGWGSSMVFSYLRPEKKLMASAEAFVGMRNRKRMTEKAQPVVIYIGLSAGKVPDAWKVFGLSHTTCWLYHIAPLRRRQGG